MDNNEEILNDDITFTPDEENSGGSTLSGESKLNKQKEKIDKLSAERDEYLLNWQKERADFVNYKREEEARITRARAIGFEKGLAGVIKMLDTYEMAKSNTDAWNSVDANWRTGIEYIFNEGIKFLEESGVQTISPNVGDMLDHNIHDAVETVDTDDQKLDGLVAKLIQKGYRNKDSIIRPAKVGVYKI
jgi:molecular chaperone GrpE